MPLLRIPTELRLIIYKHLSAYTLLLLSKVNKQLQTEINGSPKIIVNSYGYNIYKKRRSRGTPRARLSTHNLLFISSCDLFSNLEGQASTTCRATEILVEQELGLHVLPEDDIEIIGEYFCYWCSIDGTLFIHDYNLRNSKNAPMLFFCFQCWTDGRDLEEDSSEFEDGN
ncbi:hypothetical protein BJ508DRAFT_326519 [Ascobolus immersus RN42]|uniref:F-box domain-containing protein n=1 Tax=Ascobolus immersus RN42 TaxID=1160509 RepID=A0A3N4I7E1_ASCIM|nr:hypothetical protein BJ508DRAFT_326519 [Ascobolus immersus RN42]